MPDQISISPAGPRSVAGIGAFRDRDRLLAALEAEFGMTMPTTPGFVQAGGIVLSCLAPNRFLASGDRSAGLPARLAKTLDGMAAITDQSDLWDTTLLSGPGVRGVLAGVVPIDLNPEKFRIGDLALTRAGHLDVRLWRVGGEDYEIAAARSYAVDLRHALANPH